MSNTTSKIKHAVDNNSLPITVLNSFDVPVVILDKNGIIIGVNEAWRKYGAANGASTEVISGIGINYLETCRVSAESNCETAAKAIDGLNKILRGEIKQFDLEYDCHSPETRRWVDLRAVPLTGEDEGLVVGHIDITRRKLAELELQHSNIFLEEAQRIAKLGNWRWDVDSNEVHWSPELYKIFRIDPRKTIPNKNTFLECVHPDDRKTVDQAIQTILTKYEPFSIDHRIKFNDGSIKFVNSQGRVECPVDKKSMRFYGIIQDITERKETEDALRVKEKAIAASINGIGMTDPHGMMVYVNDTLVKMWGFDKPEEILGRPLPEFWHGKGVYKTVEALQERGWHQGEDTGKRKDGSLFPVEFTASMILREDGQPAFMFGSFLDISERKKAEQELKESEEKSRALLTAIPDLMFLIDEKGIILDYKADNENDLYRPPDEFLGKSIYENLPPEVARKTKHHIKKSLQTGQMQTFEYSLEMNGGQYYYEARLITKGKDQVVTIVRDITERKESEESMKQALTEIKELKDRLLEKNIYLEKEILSRFDPKGLIGNSESFRQTLSSADQVASTNSVVLLTGETGTGKEMFAHAIHQRSRRKKQSMIKVNCANLPSTLVESELFGHEKGAFTGAITRKIGRFELADKGTIFLDEIAELPLDLQSKLLRVLEYGEFERLGGTTSIKTNVRIIAATNRDLEILVEKGDFREDLYYRLDVFSLAIPPLRLRKDDIPLLAWNFIKEFNQTMGRAIDKISNESMKRMMAYDWPGNIRELRNLIERAMIVATDNTLNIELSVSKLKNRQNSPKLKEMEKQHILGILEKTRWRIEGEKGAAKLLDLNPSTLRNRMKKLGIDRNIIE